MAKKAKKKRNLNRRNCRLEHYWGKPARLVSKFDGMVLAEGDEAVALHRKIFVKRNKRLSAKD